MAIAISRTITARGRTEDILVYVYECPGGYTYQWFSAMRPPVDVFDCPAAAADHKAGLAQQQWLKSLADQERNPAPYSCQICGAALHEAYCRDCGMSDMVVETRTNKPVLAPFGQDGLNEDYYGHG